MWHEPKGHSTIIVYVIKDNRIKRKKEYGSWNGDGIDSELIDTSRDPLLENIEIFLRLSLPTFAMLTLHCHILGDDSTVIFTVKIEKTETVSILKDLIKEKMELKEIATQLVLWKVDLPAADLKEALDKIDLAESKPLFAIDELSDIFPAPIKKGRVHIVIKRPSFAKPG